MGFLFFILFGICVHVQHLCLMGLGNIPLPVINFPFSSFLPELRLNILRTSHPFLHFLDHIYSFHFPVSSVLFIFKHSKHNCFCNLGLAIANLKCWACFSCWALCLQVLVAGTVSFVQLCTAHGP